MKYDFSQTTYSALLQELLASGYSFQTVEAYFIKTSPKVAILRHDVDSWPSNALQMAKIEQEAGAKATYYFRMSPLSYNARIIKQIADFGHEIGYHYEDVTTHHGNLEKALKSFSTNLEKLRQFYPVRTIAMHGKPLSRHHNLDLWKENDYRQFGLIGEPYLSLDFDKVLYLTDTGNCWDGHQYSIRDGVSSRFRFPIHTTDELIQHLREGKLPDQIMLNIHPARWNDNLLKWLVRYYILTLPKYTAKKWVKQWRNERK
jgi:hypothetical protein